MAQLFVQDHANLWAAHALTADVYRLLPPDSKNRSGKKYAGASKGNRPTTVETARVDELTRNGALLLKRSGRGVAIASEGWSVLAGADTRLRINGVPITVGIAILRDRDELSLDGGAPLYFSTECLVRIEAYAGDDSPKCPRCTLAVEPGELSVRCPQCDITYHQRTDRECWLYANTCVLCDQSSDLEAGYRWSPEGV